MCFLGLDHIIKVLKNHHLDGIPGCQIVSQEKYYACNLDSSSTYSAKNYDNFRRLSNFKLAENTLL